NADAITLGELHRLPEEEAVVEDAVMGQRRAFRKPGRAARELDVDGVVELQRIGERGDALPFDIAAQIVNLVEAQHAGNAVAADIDREPQAGQDAALKYTRSGVGQLGRELVQHPDIVAGLETRGGDQRRTARLV